MKEQQNCSHETRHMGIEIDSNSTSKISFVSLLGKKLFFLFYIKFWFREFQARCEKLCREKWKMNCISRITIR